MIHEFGMSLIGGLLIGIAVSWMLIFHGRVIGISGIIGSLFTKSNWQEYWRIAFLAGLCVGGIIAVQFFPQTFSQLKINNSTLKIISAGLLVGFGTTMGSGCTSGHGVCGMSRLSIRSIIATACFILTGALVVFLSNLFFE
jgi:uncharacterized membrane protein YedE/YeeE